jgi:hypothetical protein
MHGEHCSVRGAARRTGSSTSSPKCAVAESSVRQIQHLLGHRNSSTVEISTHVADALYLARAKETHRAKLPPRRGSPRCSLDVICENPHMTENQFADSLVASLRAGMAPHEIGRKRSLLYDMTIDDRGHTDMGVDSDSGEPIRGRGRGFEQDILIYDTTDGFNTTVIPRVVIEVKFRSVTTHDIIVYSEKADRIKRIYPYVRYGLLLGGMRHVPGRALRLGHRFEFILTMPADPSSADIAELEDLVRSEAQSSVAIADYLYRKAKPRRVHRKLVITPAPAPDGEESNRLRCQ